MGCVAAQKGVCEVAISVSEARRWGICLSALIGHGAAEVAVQLRPFRLSWTTAQQPMRQ
ncbi:hypothetical protein GGTG_03585 [Gaeumannomyces tritici R3-111a-1]|uniref:Uncharacterized protein n=1 Tax=Gaeumannomyces tritici (strain R3-111a-1) TaxID=644352 RepID=J3NQM9_GAET3|nr:hypothetical protein GGTG_03585 [Gaeumannomyces tritici R3-111a-1]EJT78485.1 hypothetical protein GGTG_03585 [Gaeumannomyces tritici R3-111a-1]